jgi:hypothetical protein
MLKSRSYFILGATDRNNFGDILFPHIIERYIRQRLPEAEIGNYSFLKSDLSTFGAVPTRSYRQLLKDIKRDPHATVILAGGTLLAANWSTFLGFSRKAYSIIEEFETRSSALKRLNLARRIVSPAEIFRPFILDHELFQNSRICYNSVGGISPEHPGFASAASGDGGKYWQRAVHWLRHRTAHMSVRDREAEAALKENQIPVHLVPDSATLISETFDSKSIESRVSPRALALSRSRYCIVQLSGDSRKQPKDLQKFANAIEFHAASQGLKVILVPLGLAPGDEDHRTLKTIARMCPSFTYFEPRSIFDTLQLLSRSQLFIGTSLHGVIVSTIYGRPTYYFREIRKVASYMRTWFDAMGSTSLDAPEEAFLDSGLPNLAMQRSALLASQKQLVTKSLAAISGLG